MNMMLSAENVSGGYGKKEVVSNVSFDLEAGEIFGILGPNGSGKTTLLQLISGKLPLNEGAVTLAGRKIEEYSPKELAQLVAVLPQTTDVSFAYSVKETVKLGRYSHQTGLFPKWTAEDEKAVNEALEETRLWDLQDKSIQLLSGGERQRVFLARALAQRPKLLLLDEPTNHLDISHQMRLLDSLKTWAKTKSLTVITIFHDLNLASLYCDRLLLLEDGKTASLHTPDEVMKEERLKRIYETNVKRKEHPTAPSPLITFLPKQDDTERVNCIDELTVTASSERITVVSPKPLKTLSSALIGAGFQWAGTFINRHVPKDYKIDNALEEMTEYLRNLDCNIQQTVGMMTAAMLEDASYKRMDTDDFSLFVMVTAGTGNAVDISRAYLHKEFEYSPGTINSWIFLQGHLTEAAYVQAMMTATEAKVQAVQQQGILDPETGTPATGTSTDSMLVAATQCGTQFEYAGTITPIGKAIGKLMFEAVSESIERYKQRVKASD
ncbi:heme ABC transporter ATP-binding protein [Bacillus tianshenii]|nr:heme ABC transporter ATP-binding protein [Bacillus tianshenii]